MSQFLSERPAPDEFNSFYNGYVNSVPAGNVLVFLEAQRNEFLSILDNLHAQQAEYRYAPDKWSLKEVLGHMTDTEWIFSYRLLRFVRGDETPLPGMDQNVFMEGKPFAPRPMAEMVQDFNAIRTASIRLIGSLNSADFNRIGIASGFPFSSRALVWIIAGHCQHHMNVIKERYLGL